MNAAQDHCAHVAAFVRAKHKDRLMGLRDEFVAINSAGRFNDAASREWSGMPRRWRMALLLLADMGIVGAEDEMEALLQRLGIEMGAAAGRRWLELPPPERRELSRVVRHAKRNLGRLTALAAKV